MQSSGSPPLAPVLSLTPCASSQLTSPTLTISPPGADDPAPRSHLSSYSSYSSDEECAAASAAAGAGLACGLAPVRSRPASCIGQEHFCSEGEDGGPCCTSSFSASLCLQMDPAQRPGGQRRHQLAPRSATYVSVEDSAEEEEEVEENGGGGGGGGGGRERPASAGKAKEAGGSALSKIFGRPLQRSRSTGCNADVGADAVVVPASAATTSSEVPAHALFLKEKPAHAPKLNSSPKYSRKVALHGSATGLNAPPPSSDGVYEGGEKAERKKKRNVINLDVREKLNFFRRQTDVALISKAMQLKEAEKLLKTSKPDKDQVLRWGNSFDALLTDKYGLALFRGFLRTEFSDENIEFWIGCEEYKTISGSRKLASRAQKIYNDYIAVQAPREVNLDSKTRLQTITNIAHPDKHTFDQAQKRIQALMEKDSYQRFLRSDLYLSLRREVAGSSHGGGHGGGSGNGAKAEASKAAACHPASAAPKASPSNEASNTAH